MADSIDIKEYNKLLMQKKRAVREAESVPHHNWKKDDAHFKAFVNILDARRDYMHEKGKFEIRVINDPAS